jgi:hypothetical protein
MQGHQGIGKLCCNKNLGAKGQIFLERPIQSLHFDHYGLRVANPKEASFTDNICTFKYSHFIEPRVEGQEVASHGVLISYKYYESSASRCQKMVVWRRMGRELI